jgi:osmotically-inducible protein OsmY
MQRCEFITAALMAATLPIAACNRAYTDHDDADPNATAQTSASEPAVATSGTLPAEEIDDASVTSRVQAKFFLDQQIKGRRIDVDTQAGIVTLRGEVASDNERAQALLLARTTEGVERVEDALTVNVALDASANTVPTPVEPPAPAHSEDEALTSQLQTRFAEDASLKGATIAVTAKDGVLLLDGLVPSAAAKQRAIALARDAQGVVQVVDRLTIRK